MLCMFKVSMPLKSRMGQMFSTFSGEKWNYERVLSHSQKTLDQLITESPREYLIDVREIDEIKNSSSIPNAINIPTGNVQNALKFPKTFSQFVPNRPFPEAQNDKLIFTCQSGMRAGRAASTAQALGYENIAIYPGSFSDWSSKYKK